MIELAEEQIAQFNEDEFLIADNFTDDEITQQVAARYESMFRGDFTNGILPNEVNWQEGRDSAKLTR